jgi:hypothetical protein
VNCPARNSSVGSLALKLRLGRLLIGEFNLTCWTRFSVDMSMGIHEYSEER